MSLSTYVTIWKIENYLLLKYNINFIYPENDIKLNIYFTFESNGIW